MNQLQGVITAIETAEEISLVTVSISEDTFSSLVIDTPQTASYLQVGKEILMVFKETELSIGKNLSGGLSFRNHFVSIIKDIKSGKLLSNITLDYKGHMLQAIITTRSAQELKLKAGDTVVGLVKTNEVSLMETAL